MKFLICPESYAHPNGEGQTVAYYLFGAEEWNPDQDIYEQGYVIEVWERGGRTEFYVIDGNNESIFSTFLEALTAVKDIAAQNGAEFEDDTEEGLTKEFNKFLKREGMAELSVEDLLAHSDISAHQRRVLSQFLLRWNAMEETD